jgi:hypothetical protein
MMALPPAPAPPLWAMLVGTRGPNRLPHPPASRRTRPAAP